MDSKTQQQLDDMEVKISDIHALTKKTEMYMRVTFWVTVALLVVPMAIALLVVPMILSQYTSVLEGII